MYTKVSFMGSDVDKLKGRSAPGHTDLYWPVQCTTQTHWLTPTPTGQRGVLHHFQLLYTIFCSSPSPSLHPHFQVSDRIGAQDHTFHQALFFMSLLYFIHFVLVLNFIYFPSAVSIFNYFRYFHALTCM